MTEKAEDKVETLPDLDDLLQCPVCYEIPSGQIFQCNEGHHVCGRCKMRLDVCPVCRAFFFGTRNYAMEELIANVRKLRAFKLGGKVTTGSPPAEVATDTRETSSEENDSTINENVNEDENVSVQTSVRPPTACKGLFRCLCCKNTPERLPLARLLNHLRYYHSPDLIEGRSENGVYLQAWQFPTSPGRMVTAVRVNDMGIFFLVIEVTQESVHAWMSMAASPWVAQEFSYSFTLSGNDREAIFSDCVWSVRACEGSLKRRGRCLAASGADARALLAPAAMSGKLSVRRTPHELQPAVAQPRAVLRVANRSHARDPPADVAHDLEPFLQDLQNDVARLSRAFATLGREANALVRSEAEMRARLESAPAPPPPRSNESTPAPAPAPAVVIVDEPQLSRSARRRMRLRMREAFRETQISEPAAVPDRTAVDRAPPAVEPARPASNRARPQNGQVVGNAARAAGDARPTGRAARPGNVEPNVASANVAQSSVVLRAAGGQPAPGAGAARQRRASPPMVVLSGFSVVSGMQQRPVPTPTLPAPQSPFGGPSQERPTNGNARNKKKRHRNRK